MSPQSALIYGGGSIGAALAYILSKGIKQSNIVALCRSNHAIVAKNGFTINSTSWGQGVVVRPTAVASIQEAVEARRGKTPFDYIFVCTKSMPFDTERDHPMTPAVSPNTAIVLMQNGIGIEQPYRAKFPNNPIISAVIYMPVTQDSPGVFSHSLLSRFHLGTYPTKAPQAHLDSVDRLRDLLVEGGADSCHEPDIQLERWKKLLVNATENPICALTRQRDSYFFQSAPGAIPFTKDVMDEVAATARADGYPAIDDQVVQKQLEFITTRGLPGVQPSMLADAKEGKQMEADAILGNAIAIAQKHGVATPRLSALYYLINGLNHSFEGRQ